MWGCVPAKGSVFVLSHQGYFNISSQNRPDNGNTKKGIAQKKLDGSRFSHRNS